VWVPSRARAVFRQNDPSGYFYVVLSGCVGVLIQHQLIRTINEGFGFGELGAKMANKRCGGRAALRRTTLT
jgi:hypothetical protein